MAQFGSNYIKTNRQTKQNECWTFSARVHWNRLGSFKIHSFTGKRSFRYVGRRFDRRALSGARYPLPWYFLLLCSGLRAACFCTKWYEVWASISFVGVFEQGTSKDGLIYRNPAPRSEKRPCPPKIDLRKTSRLFIYQDTGAYFYSP